MISQANKRIKEALSYLDQVAGQLAHDRKYAAGATATELDTRGYEEAINHLSKARTLLQHQYQTTQQYIQDEQETEDQNPNKLSSTMSKATHRRLG